MARPELSTTPLKIERYDASTLRSAREDIAHEVLRLLWRRKGLLATMLVAGLLVAAAILVLIPPRYTADAFVVPNFRTAAVSSAGTANANSTGQIAWTDASSLVDSAARIIRSRANAGAVVARLGLDGDPAFTHESIMRRAIATVRRVLGLDPVTPASPHDLAVDALMRKVTVTNEPRSYVISVTAAADSPELAAKLANSVALEYLHNQAVEQLTNARTTAEHDLAQLSSIYGARHPNSISVRAKLDDLNRRLAALRDGLSIEDVDALGVGQSLIAADKVQIPSSPDPKLILVVTLAAALVVGIFLAWRMRHPETEASAAVLERNQHSERAMVTTLAEMYVQGGPRKVKGITEDPSGPSFSTSAISAINTQLDGSLVSFARRPLQDRCAYLFLDARHEKVREAGAVASKAVMIAVGIDWDGRPQVLGVEMANGESASAWKDFLLDLKTRGLRGVEFVVSTDHEGLVAAAAEVLPEAAWQRCSMHFLREATSYLPRTHSDNCLPELASIYDRGDLADARADIAAWLAKWTPQYPRLTAWVDQNIEQTLSFFRLPKRHHDYVSSTKLLEAFNEEVRLRSDIVRVFPSAESCLRVIRALAVEAHENWMAARSCLNMDELREHKKLALRRAA
jgi:putative transposase